MKIIVALTVLVCMATAAELALAFDPWDKQDYAMHGVFTALHTLDMMQTLKNARNPDEYHEHNPILGAHPSQGEVAAYFAVTWIAQTAIVHVLPSAWRPYAQSIMIAVPLGAVANNFSVGLGFGF